MVATHTPTIHTPNTYTPLTGLMAHQGSDQEMHHSAQGLAIPAVLMLGPLDILLSVGGGWGEGKGVCEGVCVRVGGCEG